MSSVDGWSVENWANEKEQSPIEDWFETLSDEQFKSLGKEIKLLEACGNQLRLPHSRALGKGLFELRERIYGFRVYYVLLPNRNFSPTVRFV